MWFIHLHFPQVLTPGGGEWFLKLLGKQAAGENMAKVEQR